MRHKWSEETFKNGIKTKECKVCNCIKNVGKAGTKHFIIYVRNDITFWSSPTCVDDSEEFKGKID